MERVYNDVRNFQTRAQRIQNEEMKLVKALDTNAKFLHANEIVGDEREIIELMQERYKLLEMYFHLKKPVEPTISACDEWDWC